MPATIEKKIFISSTSLDLGPVRDQVFDVCQMIGGRTVMMKHFVNAHEDPTGVSLREVEQCDWFIGIYARRYGTLSSLNGKSITENEYDLALKMMQEGRMRMWCFVLASTADWPDDVTYTDTGDQATRLKKFLNNVRIRTIGEFQNIDDLLKLVAITISKEYIFMLNGGYRFVDYLQDYPLPDDIWLPNKPYIGLSNYTRATAPVFFGRGRVVADLIKRVEGRKPIISLYGQSGVGKSSILAAGLLPRLERQGWQVLLVRRDAQQGVHQQMAGVLTQVTAKTQPTLVVFDQLEEIWTNTNKQFSLEDETRHFFGELARLITLPHIRTVLSFWKEFLSEVKRELDTDNRFPYAEFPVFGLTQEEIIESIYQISQDKDCQQEYRIAITESLPHQIAYDLRTGDQAQIAPLLQVTLTRMYETSYTQRNGIAIITFDEALYEQVRTESLATFLNEQIQRIAGSFPEAVASGLLLDLLNYFTTDMGTAAEHPLTDLLIRYAHLSNLTELVNTGVNAYLLLKNERDASLIRLSHDALAPIIQQAYRLSTAPGQQAARLLNNKSILHSPEPDGASLFSEADLKTLAAGKTAMRTWTEVEAAAYYHSRQATETLQRTLQERQQLAIRALSNGLAKDSRMALDRKQFSQAVRLAEKALEVDGANEQALERLINGHHHLPTRNELQGHVDSITTAVFSPDGSRILTASRDKTARLWDQQGKPLAILKGHTSSVDMAVFSSDGSRILTASWDETARLWDAQGKPLAILDGHIAWVNTAIFSPDGSRILTASQDKTARLWDIQGKTLAIFKGHTHYVTTAIFSPDGNRILTASYGNTPRLWDQQGNLLTTLEGHTDSITTAVFSSDGSFILTASQDKAARLWDLQGKPLAILEGHTAAVTTAIFSPDGSHILTASRDKTARVWDGQGKSLYILKGHTDLVNTAIFSPNGSRILTASQDKTARLWDQQGNLLTILEGHTGSVNTAVFSSDGNHILTASRDKTVRLWDIQGKTLAILKGHTDSVTTAVFSPDSSRILTASSDDTARLWDIQGKTLAILKGHTDSVKTAVFSPDSSRILITALFNKTASLWDQQGKSLSILEGHNSLVMTAVFSPDGSRILTALSDKTARLWDIQGKPLAILEGHAAAVTTAVFSSDGSRILTASQAQDKTARLWDAQGKPLTILEGYTFSFKTAVFSSDGSHILTTSYDHTARLWHLVPEQIMTDVCRRSVCVLTWEELKQYSLDPIEQAAGIDRVALLLAVEPHEMSLYNYARYYYEIARTQLDVSSEYLSKSLLLYDRLIEHWPIQFYQQEREEALDLFNKSAL